MTYINTFAIEVYENAKAHGFWEPEPDVATLIALIHSEWSEALEEYRAGRPMVWYQCINWEMPRDKDAHCVDAGRQSVECIGRECCKPEGIAVELIDGVLRILDIAGRLKMELDDAVLLPQTESNMDGVIQAFILRHKTLPEMVAFLHALTTVAWNEFCEKGKNGLCEVFGDILYTVFTWLYGQGVDPEDVMREKHEYNLSRPYRHGGKAC